MLDKIANDYNLQDATVTTDHPQPSSSHHHIKPAATGVLLVNLGTPSGYDKSSIRRFLAEFLSDRRVIELSPLLWQPILRGVILNTRPGKVAESYRSIWMNEQNISPLRYYTAQQAEKLKSVFNQEQDLYIDWAMRYGEPSIQSVMEKLTQLGCRCLLVVPLYPQYSATSTATVTDKVFEILQSWRRQPALRTLPPYYDHPAYIAALAESIQTYLDQSATRPDKIIASYHGIPKSCVKNGDPYFCHCSKTTRLLREQLGADTPEIVMTFQSRFGPKKWLEPATDLTLKELASQGTKHVAVITPGFAADCLETLEEIAIQNKDFFLTHGGAQYDVIPCLNDSKSGIEMLATLIRQELQGWI